MDDRDVIDLALAAARIWLGAMIFAHGWRHLRSVRGGPGIARWFESLGLSPGWLHAWSVTITELAIGAVLLAGFATPLAYAGLCALMVVAVVTNHVRNGFFIDNPDQGWEYAAGVAVLSLALAALGPGRWSLDEAAGFALPFEPGSALAVAAALGVGGTAAFLGVSWRPGRRTGSKA